MILTIQYLKAGSIEEYIQALLNIMTTDTFYVCDLVYWNLSTDTKSFDCLTLFELLPSYIPLLKQIKLNPSELLIDQKQKINILVLISNQENRLDNSKLLALQNILKGVKNDQFHPNHLKKILIINDEKNLVNELGIFKEGKVKELVQNIKMDLERTFAMSILSDEDVLDQELEKNLDLILRVTGVKKSSSGVQSTIKRIRKYIDEESPSQDESLNAFTQLIDMVSLSKTDQYEIIGMNAYDGYTSAITHYGNYLNLLASGFDFLSQYLNHKNQIENSLKAVFKTDKLNLILTQMNKCFTQYLHNLIDFLVANEAKHIITTPNKIDQISYTHYKELLGKIEEVLNIIGSTDIFNKLIKNEIQRVDSILKKGSVTNLIAILNSNKLDEIINYLKIVPENNEGSDQKLLREKLFSSNFLDEHAGKTSELIELLYLLSKKTNYQEEFLHELIYKRIEISSSYAQKIAFPIHVLYVYCLQSHINKLISSETSQDLFFLEKLLMYISYYNKYGGKQIPEMIKNLNQEKYDEILRLEKIFLV